MTEPVALSLNVFQLLFTKKEIDLLPRESSVLANPNPIPSNWSPSNHLEYPLK